MPTADAPQLKPFVFFTRFCSLRLLPTQTRVAETVTWSNFVTRSAMVNLVGLPTRPVTESKCVSQLKLGTAPWFLTKSAKRTLLKSTLHNCAQSKKRRWHRVIRRDVGVMKPFCTRSCSGVSQLKGCRPESLMRCGCLGIQRSGVHSSLLSIADTVSCSGQSRPVRPSMRLLRCSSSSFDRTLVGTRAARAAAWLGSTQMSYADM